MAASFSIGKIRDFAISSSPRYFGSEVGRFGDTITYDVSCYKITANNTALEVSSDLVSFFEQARTSNDYLEIDLNGTAIKNAKLIDFSIEGGDLQKKGVIFLTFEKYTDNSNIASGGKNTGFDASIGEYCTSFSENFDFSQNEDRKTLTHNVNFGLREQAGETSIGADADVTNFSQDNTSVARAKTFAKSLFQNKVDWDDMIVVTGLEGFNNNKNINRRYTETIDFINNEFSFSEILEVDVGTESGDSISQTLTQSITKTSDGLVTLVERGEIRGISGTMEERFSGASGAATEAFGGDSESRLLEFYKNHGSGEGDLPFGKDCEGNGMFSETSRTEAPLEGYVAYSYLIKNGYSQQCACAGSYDIVDTAGTDGCYDTLTRVITAVGTGPAISGKEGTAEIVFPKFENAKSLVFEDQGAGNPCVPAGKSVYEYFTDTNDPSSKAPVDTSKSPISASWSYNKKAGSVSINLQYSSNPKYSKNNRDPDGKDDDWMKSYELTTTTNGGGSEFKKFPFLNSEIVMGEYAQLTQGTRDVPATTTKTLTVVPVRGPDLTKGAEDGSVPMFDKLIEFAKTQLFDSAEGIIMGASYSYSVGGEDKFSYTLTTMS